MRRRSLPVRGAWVEISAASCDLQSKESRSPCGERGLKFAIRRAQGVEQVVAPRAGSVG